MGTPVPGDILRRNGASAALLRPSRAEWLGFVPLPLFAILFVWLRYLDIQRTFEPTLVLPVLNLVFLTGVSLLVATVGARSFMAGEPLPVLLLGCGALSLGIGSALAAIAVLSRFGADAMVTVHNTGALVAGTCSLIAAVLAARTRDVRPGAREAAGLVAGWYAAVLTAFLIIEVADADGVLPAFFVAGHGPTPLRQFVLGGAIVTFATAGVLFRVIGGEKPAPFILWYSYGLVLIGLGLGAVFTERAVGTPVGWLGRGAQYVGCVYMLVAVRSLRYGEGRWVIPLAQLVSEAQDRYRALVELSPDAILVHSGGKYVFANHAAARLFGAPSPEALVGRSVADMVAPPDRGAIADGIAETRSGAVTPVRQARLLRFDGTDVTVEATGAPVQFEGLPAVQIVLRDVTEQRRTEEQLRELSQRLTYHVDNSPLAVIEWGPDMRLTRWSGEAERIFGWKAEEVLGKRIEDFRWVYEEDVVAVERVSRDLESGANLSRFSANRNYRKDGSLVYCEWHNSSLRDESGQLRSILSLVLDVTDRKRMEQQLRENEERLRQRAIELAEANRVKDQFLATLSHELRTPLNAILGWSHMLVDGYVEPAMMRRAVEAIARNARAQVMLIDDVLDVSRIVSGKLRLDLRRTDIGECLQGALDSVRPAVDAKGIRIHTHRDAEVVITADPDRMQQIIWNLLSNAVKFTPEGGEVHASVRRAGTHVELEVRDNGAGIAPDMLPHMFERFWQADRSTTRKHGGLGLGLAIVRHLVELHGGQVSADSAGGGQGATFRATFPIAVPEVVDRSAVSDLSALEPPHAPPPKLRGLKVIVVDDEPDARDLLETMLQSFGAEVRTAPDSSSGLTAIRAWRPHIILSDIAMPGEDGYSFIRRLRALPAEEGGATPAVALTAYGGPDDRVRTMAAGYQQHVTKPVLPEQLAAVITSLAAS